MSRASSERLMYVQFTSCAYREVLQNFKKSISFYTEFHDVWLGEGPQVWIVNFGLLIYINKGLSKVVTVNFLLTQ